MAENRMLTCIGRKVNNIDGAQASIRDYKWYVREYKRCRSKALKRKVNDNITLIKSKLLPTRQYNLFEENISANFRDEYNIKKQTLEWMIEFPEVLSDDGTFEGFDVIIGNPPYINLEKLKVDSSIYASMHRIDEKGITQKTYQTHDSQGDLYTLFIERGLHLLRNGGHLSYIVPNKWEKVKYGRPLRELFLNKNLYQLIDFGNNQIFEDATTYTCIIRMKKEQNRGTLSHSLLNIINPETLVDSIEECNEVFETSLIDNGIWTISSRYSFDMISKCKKQMSTLGKYVGGESYRGILTGLSSAFILSKVEADQIINKDVTSKKVLRPFLQGRGLKSYVQAIPGSFLIFIPKGFTAQGMSINRDIEPLPAEEKAWEWFKNSYPAISERLEPFKNKAKKRTDKGDYWWELRACAYYDKFAEPKIFYQKFQVKPCFIYDENNIFFNDSMWFLSVSDKSV